MKNDLHPSPFWRLSTIGFLAGFLATLTVHQFALWLLRQAGIAPLAPYNVTATPPFGIPAVFSLALWGGVWGVLFTFLQAIFPRGGRYWAMAFGFGAIFPSMVALLIVAPLKGHPLGGGWHWPLLLTAFVINGAWGIGTGALLKWMLKNSLPQRRADIECRPGTICS